MSIEQTRAAALPCLVDTATNARLDLLRGAVEIQASACVALLEIASTFLALRYDEEFLRTMGNARDRMRVALATATQLEQALKDAGTLAEAATEWRLQRNGGRRV